MRRITALLMALSMCFGLVAIPTVAEETEVSSGSTTTVTVEITDEAGNPIGQKTTTTTTTITEPLGGYIHNTDNQTDWNTSRTESADKDPVTDGNTTVTENSTVVTDVTGTEQTTDNISTNYATGIENLTGSQTGSETTVITDTTTTTTTTTGVLMTDTTSEPVTTIDNQQKEGDWSEPEKTEDGQWQSTGTTSTGFQQEGDKSSVNNGTTPVDVDNDPLQEKDVTLTMDAPTGGATVSGDEKTLYISIEDALANDISYRDNQTLEDGSVVKYRYDSEGKVIGYTITSYTPTGSTNNTDPVAGTSGQPVKAGEEIKTYVKPEGYEPCVDAPILDEAGNQIGTKTVEEILDGAGNVIGYTITENIISSTDDLPDQTTEDAAAPAPVRTLPARPVPPAPKTENGLTTTVYVTDILEDGEVVGYKTTAVVTDEDGNQVSSESESIYGTVTTSTATLTRTPERNEITTTTVTTVYGTLQTQNYTVTTPGTTTNISTRDVTHEIYELVETDNGLFFLFEGRMYQVQAIGNHGTMNMTSVSPQLGLTPSGDGSINEDTDLRNPHYNDYVDVTHSSGSVNVGDGYDYKYVGYGLESSITARTTNSNGTLVHQFKLQDEQGNFHYVLCADFSTTAYRDTDYNMQNVMDAAYYDSEDARHIQAIVTNGYWGTSSGVGSLDTVKAFLKQHSNLSDTLIDGLTHGEALTATQSALWYYGNSGKTQIMSETNAAQKQYSGGYSGGWLYKDLGADEIARVDALYQALINLDPNTIADGSTELLSTRNFATETQLTIKEKAMENGAVKTDANGNEKYIADLTFSLDVKKSDLTGNLVVTVSDEKGNVIRTEQIATDSSNLVGKLLADGTTSTTENTYTIRDLELAEGVNINLNLSGTQNIAQGAYLYSAEVYSTSQTFVGLGSGTQNVNLNVQMAFSVTDPEAKVQHITETWSEKDVKTESFMKTDRYKQEKKGTLTSQDVTVNTKVYSTDVLVEVTERTTEKHRSWESAYQYSLGTIDGDDGGDDPTEPTEPGDPSDPSDPTEPDGKDKDEKDGSGTDDGDGRRAGVPKTGDITLALAAVSLFSAGGLVVLNRKREDET